MSARWSYGSTCYALETQVSRLRFLGIIYFFSGSCTRGWRLESSSPGRSEFESRSYNRIPRHIIMFNFGWMKEKLRWVKGARSATFCMLMSLKTRSARARSAAKTHYSHHIYVRMKDHVRSAACALCSPVMDSVRRFFSSGLFLYPA